MRQHLEKELERVTAELRTHLSSWEYAFAMAGGCHGGAEHPTHWLTRARTEELRTHRDNLRARLAEHTP
jgi:hypothetical protein